jgi:uncharacterized membrane-anchored protein
VRPEHPGDPVAAAPAASPRHGPARAVEGGEASAVPRGRTVGALAHPSAWAFDPHPDREAVVNELHARPFADVRPPVRVSHLAFLSAEEDAERDREHLAALCARLGAVPPAPGARHHMADFGPVAVKWERHTEFSSYTFLRPGAPADPFADPALAAVPADWLAATPGRLLVAVHLAVVPADPGRGDRELVALCGSDRYAGAVVAGGAAAVWSDFRLHGDGFVRVLAEDRGLSERQAGRLVQRLLEVETYRTAALLALPLALRLWPRLRALERQLAELACRVAEVGDLGDERALLDELARLDAEATRLAAENGYRFAAARAYHEIVRRRLSELREGRIEGLQTLGEFMDRRLLPAMETCRAMERRLETLLGRAAHASSLLRTAVDVALEAQNRDILRSMERRATQQLRLQQTVEGLSVAAVSYYLLGLLGYAEKGLEGLGVHLDPGLLAVLGVAVVVPVVWGGVRHLRHAAAPAEPGKRRLGGLFSRPARRSGAAPVAGAPR